MHRGGKLDELHHLIERLSLRAQEQRELIERTAALAAKRRRQEALKNMHDALYRMRALRRALSVVKPTGPLH